MRFTNDPKEAHEFSDIEQVDEWARTEPGYSIDAAKYYGPSGSKRYWMAAVYDKQGIQFHGWLESMA